MLFLRDAVVSQLYAASDDGQPPPAGTTVTWFLLPRGASAPAELKLADTFVLSGTYIFLESALPAGGEQAFANAAWIFLADPSFRNPRIAWFPSGVPSGGELSGYVLTTPSDNPAVTGRTLVVTYQNYALVVDNGTPFRLDAAVPAFTLTQTDQAGQPGIALTTEFGATTLAGTGSIAIPLTGADAGSFQFPLKLGQTGGVSDLVHMDAGLRTYYDTPDPSSNDVDGLVTSLRYPIFNETQTLELNASLAPWSVAEARSYFRFAAVGPAGLRSCYCTVTGFNVSMTPVTDATGPSATPAQLVFALRPSAFPASPDDLYTLVPKGDFLVAPLQETGEGPVAEVGETPAGTRWMCGLSGVEYIGLASTSALSFFTGGAAYADGFVPVMPAQTPPVTPPPPAPTKLTSVATTAWALPCEFDQSKATSLTYFAQPEGAVFYQPSQQPDFEPLVYLEIPSNALSTTTSLADAVPLLPYAGIASDDPNLDTYSLLESKVVSPNRRATVAATGGVPPPATLDARFAIKAATDNRFGGVTPQGLLALFTDTSLQMIDELVLAQMPDGSRFSLHGLPNGDPLRTAISSNQLFLVLTNPKAIEKYLSTNTLLTQITIDDWVFKLNEPDWIPAGTPTALDTAMIVKYRQGRIVDLMSDTGAWAKAQSGGGPAPNPFNIDEAATSARLLTQINKAMHLYTGGDTDFEAFFNAVTDPAWQGIMFLNVTTPVASLPDQLKGLAVGIDTSLFRADHVAIETAKIDVTKTPLSIAPSSMFGLINYNAPSPWTPNPGAYAFQVKQLKVLFLNSAVAGFSSTIDLQISTLFGEPAKLEDSADNIVHMNGVYQKHVVDGKVQESYLFQTGKASTFDMTSGVLTAVQLTRGQFVTVTSKDTATQTVSQFVFWGLLDFKALKGFDLFSFGREADKTTPAGLNFGNLVIEMDFDPTASPPTPQFTFDASQLALDLAASIARKDGLYSHFPLTLSSFTQAKAGTTPQAVGFMSVQTPLTQGSLVFPWYSLNFNINLGSPGALAAQAGFVATLTAAWTPTSSTNYSVFTGLSLPGSSGSKRQISIEGLFNITFKTLELIATDTSYILVLYNIGFSFLSFKFPPAGQVNFVLFGDPDAPSGNTSLGWYAAYAKPETNKSSGSTQNAMLTQPRVMLPPVRKEGDL